MENCPKCGAVLDVHTAPDGYQVKYCFHCIYWSAGFIKESTPRFVKLQDNLYKIAEEVRKSCHCGLKPKPFISFCVNCSLVKRRSQYANSIC